MPDPLPDSPAGSPTAAHPRGRRAAPLPRALRRAAPLLAAPLAGAMTAGGFQPVALWPLALFGLAVLAALIAAARGPGQAALRGWLWGVGHFTLGNSWIATAFTYQAKMPAWLGGVAVVLLALYLAVYPALAAGVAGLLARRRAGALVPALAAAWIVSEWLRGWVFTGFAWNPLGAAALGGFGRAGLAQVLPWTGTYGLSGLVALLGALWWYGWTLRVVRPGLAVALVVLPLAAGRIPQLTPPAAPGRLAFTLVQPGIPQDELDDPARFEAQFLRTARLSLPGPATPPGPRLVLWPESGSPDYLREGYPAYVYEETTFAADPLLARRRLGRLAGPGGLLLTGTVDLVMTRRRIAAARNVVTALDAGGAIRGSYAKAHLVPYGEYLPLRSLLAPLGLSRLVAGSLDFEPGPGPRTLDLGPWGRAGVQICYEIVFPGAVVDPAHRPDYLFNPTNDGWFGAAGPPQHLAQARLRAIEEGLPVLRATTNGISAVIDADGRVVDSLPRPVAGRIDGRVPPAHAPTPFSRLGNALSLGWAVLLALCSALALRRGRR